MSEETKTQTLARAGGLQRSAEESKERESIKAKIRKEIAIIRQGHATGGYCDSEKLRAAERPLYTILASELEELEAKVANPNNPATVAVRRELAGLSYQPRLVVAKEEK